MLASRLSLFSAMLDSLPGFKIAKLAPLKPLIHTSMQNASLTALNLAKVALAKEQPNDEPLYFSVGSLKRTLFNEHLLELFICYLDLDPTLIKSHPLYPELLEYGSLAA
jgi:hypothetical protein